MTTSQPYDAQTIAVLRRALDDVFADRRFIRQQSTSALEIAEHLLAQAAAGEREGRAQVKAVLCLRVALETR